MMKIIEPQPCERLLIVRLEGSRQQHQPATLSFKLLNEKKGDSGDRDSIIVSYKISMVMITNLMRLLT